MIYHHQWRILPGSLCRVSGILHNPKKLKGFGIIIEEADVDFGYGRPSEFWIVLINGKLCKVRSSIIWPI